MIVGGQRRRTRTGRGGPTVGEAEFRETEIEHLRLAPIGDENIRRFDIAVNDAFRVRRVERVGDVDGERQQLLERQRIAVDRFLERSAFEQFQNEKRFPVVFADLEDLDSEPNVSRQA